MAPDEPVWDEGRVERTGVGGDDQIHRVGRQRAQPVDGLTEIGDQRDVHLAEQAAQIFRSEIGVVIKKLPRNTRAAYSANIGGKNFSL